MSNTKFYCSYNLPSTMVAFLLEQLEIVFASKSIKKTCSENGQITKCSEKIVKTISLILTFRKESERGNGFFPSS